MSKRQLNGFWLGIMILLAIAVVFPNLSMVMFTTEDMETTTHCYNPPDCNVVAVEGGTCVDIGAYLIKPACEASLCQESEENVTVECDIYPRTTIKYQESIDSDVTLIGIATSLIDMPNECICEVYDGVVREPVDCWVLDTNRLLNKCVLEEMSATRNDCSLEARTSTKLVFPTETECQVELGGMRGTYHRLIQTIKLKLGWI